jgi:GTP-binding protein HflX
VTQLETDRRLIGERVKALRARLAKLRKQRETQRRSRGRSQTFSVSLVGYTNAGKSTLFNAVTKAGVYVADQLFATLDTTSRRVYMGEEVGNGGDPTRSASCANCRTSWWPRSAPRWKKPSMPICCCMSSTPRRRCAWSRSSRSTVLKEIGADHIPQILVWNKIDAAGLEPSVER